jgi:tetratricopeptide (TPR) repeat protein
MALGSLGRYEEALASFDKAIELDPNDAWAWSLRGMALVSLGRYEEALASFDKAIDRGIQFSHFFFKRAEVILGLNRWEDGCMALEEALDRFAQADEPYAGDTAAIVRNLFHSTHDAATWRMRIAMLIELYDKYQVLSALGQGLVLSIATFTSPLISDAAARLWRDVWQELARDRQEFTLPLRLLDAAVRYRETRDLRVLLELPVEERSLLEPLLEIGEPSKS